MTPQGYHRHMRQLRKDMQDALIEFRNYDAKWNRFNEALNVKFEAEGRDILAIAQAKEANVTLQGYMSAATWWRDKAQCLGTVILAEQAAQALLGER